MVAHPIALSSRVKPSQDSIQHVRQMSDTFNSPDQYDSSPARKDYCIAELASFFAQQ